MEKIMNTHVNRRAIFAATGLAGTVAATAAAGSANLPTQSKIPDGNFENPVLLELGNQLAFAVGILDKAEADFEAAIVQWHSIRPEVPKELVSKGPHSRPIDATRLCDPVGRPIDLDADGRPIEWRDRIYVLTAAKIQDEIELMSGRWRKSAWRQKAIAEAKRLLPIAQEYEAEYERSATVSGVATAKTKRDAADVEIRKLADRIAGETASTLAGLEIKALAANARSRVFWRACPDLHIWPDINSLADAVLAVSRGTGAVTT